MKDSIVESAISEAEDAAVSARVREAVYSLHPDARELTVFATSDLTLYCAPGEGWYYPEDNLFVADTGEKSYPPSKYVEVID